MTEILYVRNFKKNWFIYRLLLNYFISVIWLGLSKTHVWVRVYLFWHYKEKKTKMTKGENLTLVRSSDIGYKIKFEVRNLPPHTQLCTLYSICFTTNKKCSCFYNFGHLVKFVKLRRWKETFSFSHLFKKCNTTDLKIIWFTYVSIS